jgi:hypothetical protein
MKTFLLVIALLSVAEIFSQATEVTNDAGLGRIFCTVGSSRFTTSESFAKIRPRMFAFVPGIRSKSRKAFSDVVAGVPPAILLFVRRDQFAMSDDGCCFHPSRHSGAPTRAWRGFPESVSASTRRNQTRTHALASLQCKRMTAARA